MTNLSALSASLTVLDVPGGDYEACKSILHLNFNLRRLSCTGRSALTLQAPSSAHRDRFRQLFKSSDAVDFSQSVFELVKLIQTSVYLLRLFDRQYIDGIICDRTILALRKFIQVSSDLSDSTSIFTPSLAISLLNKITSYRRTEPGYSQSGCYTSSPNNCKQGYCCSS